LRGRHAEKIVDQLGRVLEVVAAHLREVGPRFGRIYMPAVVAIVVQPCLMRELSPSAGRTRPG
jgi:hypothetical protein